MTRPTAGEGLLDGVSQAVPERVRKRLAAGNPAEGWTWATADQGGTETTDTGETVTLGAAPVTVGSLACSCLLGPRCLHVLAVAAALPSSVVAAPPPEPAPVAPARPVGAPGLLDAVGAAVPERVKKRLGDPNPADGWAWERGADGWTVRTDGGDLVKVTAEPVSAEALACSCLLAPRCLHVLAVATAIARPAVAPTAPAPSAAAAAPAAPEPPPPPPEEAVPLDGGQRAVVTAVTRAARAVLHAGATGVGATAREDLRRAAHASRAVGLHRLARAGTRVLRQVTDLQSRRPSFTLGALTEDLRELLFVAHELGRGAATRSTLGVGRRAYSPVGALRLYGLCTEPVVSAGFGGTSTLLCDAQGRLWTASDVMPSNPGGGPGGPALDAGRARATYDAAANVGGATLPHRQLCRQGLFVQDATASDDGRLGSGAGVRAVRAGPSSWDDDGPRRRFAEPAERQLGRAIRGGESWLFLTATVLGADELGLVLAVEGLSRPVRGVPASDHTELAFRDDLRLLARAPGLRLRVIARHVPRPRTISLVAVGQAPGEAPGELRLILPEEWGGRCNLGYDRLVAAHAPGLQRDPAELPGPEGEDDDPLVALRRRVERMALGGRGTLPGDVRGAVEREAAALGARHLPTGAAALIALAEAAAPGAPPDHLADAWLAAAVYDQAATRAILARTL